MLGASFSKVCLRKILESNFGGTHNQSIVKRSMCSLAAVLCVAVANAVFAAAEYQKMTGTVVASDIQGFEIETATKEHGAFHMEAGKPTIGERVTVYYDLSQRDRRGSWFAMKVEKGGKAGKGSKKD